MFMKMGKTIQAFRLQKSTVTQNHDGFLPQGSVSINFVESFTFQWPQNCNTTGYMRLAVLYRVLIRVQGIYTLITALWGLLHIESFMAVTGPKTDIWLVKTVAVLLIPICIPLFWGILHKTYHPLIALVSLCAAAGLAAIDFYYTANGTIKWIYALDGILELLFVLAWLLILAKNAGRKN